MPGVGSYHQKFGNFGLTQEDLLVYLALTSSQTTIL